MWQAKVYPLLRGMQVMLKPLDLSRFLLAHPLTDLAWLPLALNSPWMAEPFFASATQEWFKSGDYGRVEGTLFEQPPCVP